MIARIVIPLLLVIVLSDVYIDATTSENVFISHGNSDLHGGFLLFFLWYTPVFWRLYTTLHLLILRGLTPIYSF